MAPSIAGAFARASGESFFLPALLFYKWE